MKEFTNKTVDLFRQKFSVPPDFIYYAPGRVNLIGEHTDYNGGFVFPCAIDRGTFLAIKLRTDTTVNVMSVNFNNQTSQWRSDQTITPDSDQPWANYLRGVNDQFFRQGKTIQGMDIVALGNIPQGAGLSSSASFEVAFATAINEINNFKMTATKVARICQAAENQFVGCNCGIMDQLISAAGKEQHALLIDCKSLSFHPIALPQNMAIVVIDSKVKRDLVDSEYNDRRQQCEAATAKLEVSCLRDATAQLLENNKKRLSDLEYKRARHVITENARAEKAALAFQMGDYRLLSRLMEESHTSMRDDFEITTPELDYLVEIIGGVLKMQGGVRMTGGGFGGCVVAMVPNHLVTAITEVVGKKYTLHTGLTAEVHQCVASAGARRYEI